MWISLIKEMMMWRNLEILKNEAKCCGIKTKVKDVGRIEIDGLKLKIVENFT